MEKSTSKHTKRIDDVSSAVTQMLLLPGLPNDTAERCLASLPPRLLFSVSRAWRRLLYSPSFPPFFSLYALLSPKNSSVEFFSLDPISSAWEPLPPPPSPAPRILHRHPSFLSRKLPVQSLAASNNLILAAATTHHLLPALSSPLAFNPGTNTWFSGPHLPTSRRWCAAASVGGVVYVASGVGAHYSGDVGRSMEAWDLKSDEKDWKWEKKAQLRDGRFSREACEAVGFKGSLCMVNLKGKGPKEGAVYDVESDRWTEMPAGMRAGWNGPAASTMQEEDAIYAVDEGSGALRRYDDLERDEWDEVIKLPELRGAEHVAAARGRVCVVCENGERVAVVDVASRPAKAWMVDPPSGFQGVAVHVLPRMSKQHH